MTRYTYASDRNFIKWNMCYDSKEVVKFMSRCKLYALIAHVQNCNNNTFRKSEITHNTDQCCQRDECAKQKYKQKPFRTFKLERSLSSADSTRGFSFVDCQFITN